MHMYMYLYVLSHYGEIQCIPACTCTYKYIRNASKYKSILMEAHEAQNPTTPHKLQFALNP